MIYSAEFGLVYGWEFVDFRQQSEEKLLNSEGGSAFIVDNPHVDKDAFFPPKLLFKLSCWHKISLPIISIRKLLRTASSVDG